LGAVGVEVGEWSLLKWSLLNASVASGEGRIGRDEESGDEGREREIWAETTSRVRGQCESCGLRGNAVQGEREQ